MAPLRCFEDAQERLKLGKLEDLIAQVDDSTLRHSLATAASEAKESRNFGLIFEQHIPETVAVLGLPVRRGQHVRLRSQIETGPDLVVTKATKKSLALTAGDGATFNVEPDDVAVVKRFGEPIYPTLTPLGAVRRSDGPAHTVINGENYHALQTLLYLYEGQIDCIYIDPPYNTGARDWKYNNRYVDEQDSWRHSKWLSFIEKRLVLAKRLLKEDSVLIVTIDEHEVHHLGMLLRQTFPEAFVQMVTIVVNPKGVAQGRFARVEEYAFFCFRGESGVGATDDDFMSDSATQRNTRFWKGLLRAGTNALPSDGLNLVYPIGIEQARGHIVGVGRTMRDRIEAGEISRENCDSWLPDPGETVDGYPATWPMRRDGALGVWQAKPETLLDLNEQGFLRAALRDGQWALSYVPTGIQRKIRDGEIVARNREPDRGPVVLERLGDKTRAKTVWKRAEHDAGWHGSVLLRELLGSRRFDFPKSVFAVRDSLLPIVGDKPDALILDFFAGSGTTMHAVALMNRLDNGTRRSVLVTNNEVSESDGKRLRRDGHSPGDAEWERAGIFESVTRPRCEAVVSGRRPDGRAVAGEYPDGTPRSEGFFESVEFYKLDYLDPDSVRMGDQLRAVLPMLRLAAGARGALPTPDADAWLMPSDASWSVLVDDARFGKFKAALERRPDLTHVWLVTTSEESFARMRSQLPAELRISMLYRDYLRNFEINTEQP